MLLRRHDLFEKPLCKQQPGRFQFLAGLTARAQLNVCRWNCIVVTKHRIVPAFDVQIGIISSSQQRVNNLGPICLAKARKTMLGDARMANSIHFEKLAIDECVFGVNVKYSRAELVDVLHWVNELTEQV